MADLTPSARTSLDALDVTLLSLLTEHPRAGVLELSRLASVARPTVQSRLSRMEADGVIMGYGPDIDLTAAGYPVQAFVALEIAQGALDEVSEQLSAIPGVIEAYATTGASDLLCRVAAASHTELQQTLLAIDRSPVVARSTSTIVLSVVVPPRVLPLLAAEPRRSPTRTRAYRRAVGGPAEAPPVPP